MKKCLLFLMMSFVVCITAWGQLRGDLNNDDQVDVTDVDIMIDMVLGKQAQELTLADLDNNNMLDVTDVGMLIDIVLGKVSEPVEPSGLVLSVGDINLISAVAYCKFDGLVEGMECGVIVKKDNSTLTFSALAVAGEQQVALTGLKPWTTYQCYAFIKIGKDYIYYQEEPVTFSTPDLVGTWGCTEYFDKNQSESSTIEFSSNGRVTFNHVSGYKFMSHTTNSGSWSVNNNGTLTISFSDASDGSWPMYYQKVFTGTFDNLVHPTKLEGNVTRIWGSSENHYSYGTFSMTRQP